MKKATQKAHAISLVDAMAPALIHMSQFLHQNPELGGQEYRAANLLVTAAEEQGFTVRKNISGYETAFIAHKGTTGPKIAFLAEYDALPGLGHACGHNLIAAMSFGAAVAFATATGNQATSYLIGCPAEETSGSKVAMSADGVFNGLTAALIVHPANDNYMGASSYASHPLNVTFHGRSAHVASKSDKGINALDALMLFYHGLKIVRQTFSQETIVAGIVMKGGTAPNVVPIEASANFTIRALSSNYLESQVLPAINRLAAGVALATDTSVETSHYEPLYKELFNDPHLLQLFKNNMAILGEKVTLLRPEDATGSTDVGNVSHVAPTIHPHIAIGDHLVAHTPEFAIASSSAYAQQRILIGAKAMAMTAIDLLDG